MSKYQSTERTTLKRLPKRGEFDRETIWRILDEAFVCHVGFIADGCPVVIPTCYGRIGDQLYIHGSAASRMLRNLSNGVDVCVTVTLTDGLVLARSAFHHSVNYRSVVIFGNATLVDTPEEKMTALKAITNQVVPNRWEEVREPNDQELKATMVLSLPINEVSAKLRTGGPVDDEADYQLPVWAGVIPVQTIFGAPMNDELLSPDIQPSASVQAYSRVKERV